MNLKLMSASAIAVATEAGIPEDRTMQGLTSLSGKTIRWTLTEGTTAGITFEHDFHADGSVEWRALNGAYKGAHRKEKHYGAVKIDANIWVVSYLAESGHTLTVRAIPVRASNRSTTPA